MYNKDGQYDASFREQKLVADRAKLRADLRAEFVKQYTNPYNHMKGEGGYLFDPAMQRWMSMRAYQYDYFKPTLKTLVYPIIVFGSIGILTYVLTKARNKREKSYRTGEVSYRDRKFKFI